MLASSLSFAVLVSMFSTLTFSMSTRPACSLRPCSAVHKLPAPEQLLVGQTMALEALDVHQKVFII